MAKGGASETPYERVIGALNEWLEAFDVESAALVREELQQISPNDTPERILARVDHALRHLDEDAARLHERGEQENRQAEVQEQRALDAIRAGDDHSAKDALMEQNNHLERATEFFDEALQLKWLLNQFRSAAASMHGRGSDETEPDDAN